MELHCRPSQWACKYEIITLSDDVKYSYEWHKCSSCEKTLPEKELFKLGFKTFCWKCCRELHGLRCFYCKEYINGLSKISYVYFDDQTWHNTCFRCPECRRSLVFGIFFKGNCIHCAHCQAHIKYRNN